ncbi:MAG TPA: signal recognition particle protein [Acidobacteriota bacterium]
MFDQLSARLQDVFASLRRQELLNAAAVDGAMRELRLVLLEADVHFKVVGELLQRVRARAVGAEVLESLSPAQAVVRILREELIQTLGSDQKPFQLQGARPLTLLLVGLQGSGKTTTCGKLARRFLAAGQRVLVVSTDVRRPAALEQLALVGRRAGAAVHPADPLAAPERIAAAARAQAERERFDLLLVDTAGRLHIDTELMEELVRVDAAARGGERWYVCDSTAGQDALRAAAGFGAQLPLSGVVLTKLDSDTRGGSALSVRAALGVPIHFVGIGEAAEDLEPFQPPRMVSRLLGMGDVLALIERAETAAEGHQQELRAAAQAAQRGRGSMDLEDFRIQLRAVAKLGPLGKLIELLPGAGALGQRAELMTQGEQRLKRVEAILNSMTPQERRNPRLLDGSRRQRIARGSGTAVSDINRLLKDFQAARQLMARLQRPGKRGAALPRLH